MFIFLDWYIVSLRTTFNSYQTASDTWSKIIDLDFVQNVSSISLSKRLVYKVSRSFGAHGIFS